MITIHLKTARNPRGPGYWKLNTHLLTETQYVDLIRKLSLICVRNMKARMKLTRFYYGSLSKWEKKIREASLNCAAARKRRLKNRENLLQEEVLALENELDERNISYKLKESTRTELRIKKQQIEEIIAHKTQGAILRSKVKRYNEGEKNIHISIIWRSGTLIVKLSGTSKAQMEKRFRQT